MYSAPVPCPLLSSRCPCVTCLSKWVHLLTEYLVGPHYFDACECVRVAIALASYWGETCLEFIVCWTDCHIVNFCDIRSANVRISTLERMEGEFAMHMCGARRTHFPYLILSHLAINGAATRGSRRDRFYGNFCYRRNGWPRTMANANTCNSKSQSYRR